MRRAAAITAVLLLATAAPALGAGKPLSAADRAAIDRTLDVFVPAAIAREHPARAWPLVTAAMRQGTDRAMWAAGTLPVPPFPVIGASFHGWTIDRVGPGRADIVLLVHLKKGAALGGVSFNVAMRKIRGRWLVDSAVPAATFAAPGSTSAVLAQPDFAPQPGQAFSKTGRISDNWILIIPATLLGLIVLTPIVVIAVHRVRDRGHRRQDASEMFRNRFERRI
jgi:hypothetical protein